MEVLRTLRIASCDLKYLIAMTGHTIGKRGNNYRKSIPIKVIFVVTLRSLEFQKRQYHCLYQWCVRL